MASTTRSRWPKSNVGNSPNFVFEHLSVDTGRTVSVKRKKITHEITAAMRMATIVGMWAPEKYRLRLRNQEIQGGWSFTICADPLGLQAPYPYPSSPAADEMVECHVAEPGGGAAVWKQLEIDRAERSLIAHPDVAIPVSEAWVAVSFLPGLPADLSVIPWCLDDVVRFMTWSLLLHGRPVVKHRAA